MAITARATVPVHLFDAAGIFHAQGALSRFVTERNSRRFRQLTRTMQLDGCSASS
jgi:hypothetical protein